MQWKIRWFGLSSSGFCGGEAGRDGRDEKVSAEGFLGGTFGSNGWPEGNFAVGNKFWKIKLGKFLVICLNYFREK